MKSTRPPKPKKHTVVCLFCGQPVKNTPPELAQHLTHCEKAHQPINQTPHETAPPQN